MDVVLMKKHLNLNLNNKDSLYEMLLGLKVQKIFHQWILAALSQMDWKVLGEIAPTHKQKVLFVFQNDYQLMKAWFIILDYLIDGDLSLFMSQTRSQTQKLIKLLNLN